ncbi:MAG: phosphopantetheine-binding protein [Sphingobacteriales bacterium]|nr:phosphopantetheine-binding protein [Sphingobacteriales bacterium]
MGLDSVELLMEWEDFFQIRIQDLEAAQIGTIADAVNYISTHISYVDRGLNIKEEVLKDLIDTFSKLNIPITFTDQLFKVLSADEEDLWNEIARKAHYELPLTLSSRAVGKWYDKLLPPKVNYSEVSVARYVDLICAVNYQTLIQQDIQNQYEVMIAVMGITIEKIGVSPFEVFLTSSFTNDLGID